MIAIDANVVVRFLTGDHAEQSAKARQMIEAEPVFVTVTVILEVEWVLRSAYGFRQAEVVRALRAFGGLPRVTIDAAAVVAEALDRVERGMDFADALHLGCASHCEAFVSFDRRFAKAARAIGLDQVREI